MATTWESLLPSVRGLLGDLDVEAPRFATDGVYQQFNLIPLLSPDLLITANSADEEYTEDLSSVQQAEVILRAAIQLLLPLPNEFTYRTPVSYVSRKDLKASLLSYLQDRLDTIRGDRFPVESQGVVEAIVKDTEQYVVDLDAATSVVVE